ncbi:MAG: DUF1761 domain-containing protein [Bacteroidetes bacterium]|nr:DUF1761 domain-containing protein [Bacteroidota bacterium]
MFENYLQNQNWLALICGALAQFLIGSVWFSGLFGPMWAKELEKHGTKIERPDTKGLMGLMIGSLIYNLITTFGISYVVYVTGCANFTAGLKMGALLGVCLAFATLGGTYLWQSRSNRLLLLDGGNHVLGIVVCTVLLSVWK